MHLPEEVAVCGIAGVISRSGRATDPAVLARASEALAHRGPDGRGTWVGSRGSAGVGLAHTRLAVIDPAGSAQPMVSGDGRHVVVLNGEILNFRDLRRGLDHTWRTEGDTETLLVAFQRHGPAAFAMLVGQFACAVVDTATGRTWLARDRMGVLPLYWTARGDTFAFASEPKALVPATGPLNLDESALDEYLARRAVWAPRTLYRDVHKVPPGHVLTVDGGRPGRPEPFWSLPASEPGWDAETAIAAVEDLLRTAVRRALVADVPVGAYLSGGLDSSLLAAIVADLRTGGERTHTFAATFGDPRVDEGSFARLVAEHVGTQHHKVRVTADDFTRLWPLLSRHRDAPISEPADVAVHRLAAAAREHVTVVLSGEGADELFGGYPKHAFAGVSATTSRVPRALRAPVLEAVQRRLPPSQQRLRIALRALGGGGESQLFEGWFSPFTAHEREELLGRPSVEAPVPAVPGPDGPDALTRMLLLDCGGWLADNLLERGDRMSMAASVELRPPFLDPGVVDLAFRLPSGLKVRGRDGKWVLKQVARRYLPETIVGRPKSGFRVPLDTWFRDGLQAAAHDLLTDPSGLVGGRFSRPAVHRLLDDHARGRHNESIRLWTLVSLEVWYRECVRDTATAPAR